MERFLGVEPPGRVDKMTFGVQTLLGWASEGAGVRRLLLLLASKEGPEILDG
jgi:hypothetical protein